MPDAAPAAGAVTTILTPSPAARVTKAVAGLNTPVAPAAVAGTIAVGVPASLVP